MLNIKDFREVRSLSAMQVVDVVSERFPGYDKYLNSKVENTGKYGVRLVREAEMMLEEAFKATVPEPRKRDRHKLRCKVQCRVSQTKMDALQKALREDGYDTVQAGLLHIIDKYLEGIANEKMSALQETGADA